MKKLIKQDKIRRYFVYKNELKQFVLKSIKKNKKLSIILQWKSFVKLSKILNKSSSISFVNRCVITGRKKRFNKSYSFSRIMFLKFVRLGYVNGLKKSSW